MGEEKKSTIAERLENLRDAMSLTWTELADFLGISRKSLFLLRTGAHPPTPQMKRKLCDAEATAREKCGEIVGKLRAHGAFAVSESLAGYGVAKNDQLLLELARENAAVKTRLAELDARLRRLEGRDGG